MQICPCNNNLLYNKVVKKMDIIIMSRAYKLEGTTSL